IRNWSFSMEILVFIVTSRMENGGGDTGPHGDDDRGEARIGGQSPVELADGEDARIVSGGIEKCLTVPTAGAQHVIGEQQSAWPQNARGPVEKLRVVRLVRVEKDHVEGRVKLADLA